MPTSFLQAVAAESGDASPSCFELVDPAGALDLEIERIGRAILTEMQAGLPLSQLQVDALGQELAIRILRQHSDFAHTGAVDRREARGGLAPWQLKRATEYIEDRLADDVSLTDLPKLLGLSTFHVGRAFKQSTGLP